MWKALASADMEMTVTKLCELLNKRSSAKDTSLSLQKPLPPCAHTLPDQKFVSDAERLRSEHLAQLDAAITEQESECGGNFNEQQHLVAQEILSKVKETGKFNKKLLYKLGQPKKPVSAFTHFAKTLSFAVRSITEIRNLAAEKWTTMTADEKKPFYARAKTEKWKYRSDMKRWAADMMEKGLSEILPVSMCKRKVRTSIPRFRNPFDLFRSENREKIQRELLPYSEPGDRFKLAASMWKALTPEDRDLYVAKFREMRSKYRSTNMPLQKQPPVVMTLFVQFVSRTVGYHEPLTNCAYLWKHLKYVQKEKFISEALRLNSVGVKRGVAAFTTTEELFAMKNVYKIAKAKRKHNKNNACSASPLTIQDQQSTTETEENPLLCGRAKTEQENYKTQLDTCKNATFVNEPNFRSLEIKPLSAKELLGKLAVEYGKPRPPNPSAYWRFLKTLAATSERANLASRKWEHMTEAERKPFYDETAAAYKQYKADLELWRQKMIENGNQAILMQMTKPVVVKTKK